MRHSPAALLVALLAGPASAAMPTWPVNGEETYTQWPTMSFHDGKTAHSLYCRLSECEPGKGKGIVNLYSWAEVGEPEPIKSTILIVKYYDKWDPRRIWNGDWYTVPEVVDSHRRTYQTKLSHWKVDMDAKPIVAFQDKKRFPATSSVGQAAMSATGSKIKVLPPTQMAEDRYKPDTSRTTPAPPRNRDRDGNGGNSAPRTPEAPAPAPVPEAPAGVLALTAQEQLWLTRAEKAGCADAAKAADCRAKVKANLRPEAVAAWEKAVATKKAAEIDASLAMVEMWGRGVTTGVGPAGANTEIQLSVEEYEKLKKDAAAAEKYNDERAGLTGGSEGKPINRAFYDPVALHQITEAYRKTLGGGETPASGRPATEISNGALTDAELALLTPDELLRYRGMKKAHENDPNNPAMLALNQELRKKIKEEGRTPYTAPDSEAAFNGMQDWQKKKFCAELDNQGAAAADTKSDFNQGKKGDATVATLKKNVEDAGEKSHAKGHQKSAGAPSWAADACKKFKADSSYTGGGNGGREERSSAKVDVPIAKDKEKEKEPSKLFAPKHLYNAGKGALLGLLIGSFVGGPIGFLVGAAAGGLTFFAVSHLQNLG